MPIQRVGIEESMEIGTTAKAKAKAKRINVKSVESETGEKMRV
jgi:hypothetical protein